MKTSLSCRPELLKKTNQTQSQELLQLPYTHRSYNQIIKKQINKQQQKYNPNPSSFKEQESDFLIILISYYYFNKLIQIIDLQFNTDLSALS